MKVGLKLGCTGRGIWAPASRIRSLRAWRSLAPALQTRKMLFLYYSLPASLSSFWSVHFALYFPSWLSAPGACLSSLGDCPQLLEAHHSVLGERLGIFVRSCLRFAGLLRAWSIYPVTMYILASLLFYYKLSFAIYQLCTM